MAESYSPTKMQCFPIMMKYGTIQINVFIRNGKEKSYHRAKVNHLWSICLIKQSSLVKASMGFIITRLSKIQIKGKEKNLKQPYQNPHHHTDNC
jgi:hypothetical protein